MAQGKRFTGHPVDVASGAQVTAWHDIVIPGSIPLIWRRFYSTELLEHPASIQGRGWVHFFEMWLERDINGYRLFTYAGGEVEFDDPDGRVESGGSVFSPGDFMELRRERDRYVVCHWHDWATDVRKLIFPVVEDQRSHLEAISTPAGHALALTYDKRRRLSEVRQTLEERRLMLDYDANGLLGRLLLASPVSDPAEVAR